MGSNTALKAIEYNPCHLLKAVGKEKILAVFLFFQFKKQPTPEQSGMGCFFFRANGLLFFTWTGNINEHLNHMVKKTGSLSVCRRIIHFLADATTFDESLRFKDF